MYDQRSSRLKCIGSLDAIETRRIMKRDQRKEIKEKNEVMVPNVNANNNPIIATQETNQEQ